MKKLIGVDEKLGYFTDEIDEKSREALPTYRKLFKAAVGMVKAKDGDQAIDLHQLGLKLCVANSDGCLEIEDAEFKLLKQVCGDNPVQWIASFHGQVMVRLKESEK